MYHDPIPALKAALGEELTRVLRTYDTWDAAIRAGSHRSEVSRIRNGHLERVSLERLIRMLARVRRRVEMRIIVDPMPKAAPGARGGANVDAAGGTSSRSP